MKGSNVLKWFGLICGVMLLNIMMLSPGLLGIRIGTESAFETALAVTVLFISLLVLLYGSYALLLKTPIVPPVKDIRTHEDYINALNYYRDVKVLKKDIALAIEQLERLEKKKDTLLAVLNQRFDQTELSYKKFISVIYEVEKLFYRNNRGILNKLNVFDASEYTMIINQQRSTPSPNKFIQQKIELYNEYLSYVTGYLGANEEILLKLDKLLLEISLLDSTDYRVVEEMPCMKELDALIKQTKFYKQ